MWWYVDAISDDGQHGITIIAFVGSVFSPYYAWANQKAPADPNNYCCINVAIYTPGKKRWAMTERTKAAMFRDADHFSVGPSDLTWDGNALTIQVNERSLPFAQKISGKITVYPEGLFHYSVPLDTDKKHRWGPISPTSRVTVDLPKPGIKWSGHAYLDSNEGDEGIHHPFKEWDWARATLKDGSTAVIYDVREKSGEENLLLLRFTRSGKVETFGEIPRQALPLSMWRIQGHLRSQQPVQLLRSFEDTPFYTRSLIAADWLGEPVQAMHETLNVPRFSSTIVKWMLPWRMPRIPTL